MIKSKKQMFIAIGAFALVLLLGTTTYAFFNYTRTGASNTIKVGRINFISKNEQTITLNNLFPIDPSNTTDMNDNTKVGTYSLTIEGDTDYSGGIEYLVSVANSSLSNLPISIDMTVGSGLGTNDTNYFTSRDTATTPIYKKIIGNEITGDQMLLVGFIPQNTTLGTSDEVGDTITIKAYLDKNKILISDTVGIEGGTPSELTTGKTVFTTTEWNALSSSGVSFKIKVEANEGIWVNGSLEEIMKTQNLNTTTNQPIMDNVASEFVSASTGIDFGHYSSDTNGKGVYMRAGTQNDAYPIMYYRGAVENNNVLFNNFCWKAVRTTDTGGVKLIYNGELSDTYGSGDAISRANYTNVSTPVDAFTYDTTDNSWNITITDGSNPSISFNVPTGDNYSLVMTGTSSLNSGGTYFFKKNGSTAYSSSGGGGTPYAYTYSFGTLTVTDVVTFSFYGSATAATPIAFKLIMQQNGSAISRSNYTIVGDSFTFNETTKKWSSTVEQSERATMEFNVSEGGDYFINYINPNGGPFYIYKNGTAISTSSGTQIVKLFNLQPTDKIIVDYSQSASGSGVVEFYISEAENLGLGCENIGADTQITLNNTNAFQFSGNNLYKSPAYVGYMWGTVYEYKKGEKSGTYWSDVQYNGSVYALKTGGTTNESLDSGYHYICEDSSNCTKIRYYYNTNYYIELERGDTVESAIKKMQTNTTNSNAKIQIDSWYASNMNTVTSKLEDTIWCNDRSIGKYNGWLKTGSWNAGYDKLYSLLFGSFERSGYASNDSMVKNMPSLACTNKNDSFTVSNGNGNQKLTYPAAMLTEDEIVLAGGVAGGDDSSFYLNNGSAHYWTLSPSHFEGIDLNNSGAYVSFAGGGFVGYGVWGTIYPRGLRPAISIKQGLPITKGTGTVLDPYVIE